MLDTAVKPRYDGCMNNSRNSQLSPPATVGLLGGSFNPAHAGHVHISREAIKRLGLDAVWWLLSPQNPLKSRDDMAPYATRAAHAEALLKSQPRIQLSHFEQEHGLQYTCDTVAALQRAYPQTRFVWLMGADNLHSFHRWKNAEDIAARIPICVFDRAPFSFSALASKTAKRYASERVTPRALVSTPSPAWSYLFIPRHSASATEIREKAGKSSPFVQE